MENQSINAAEEKKLMSPEEMDAIGEVMNISMGSSATAISSMLDKQVIITTPQLTLQKFGNMDYSNLEPAVVVKIRFSEGIIGTNIMLFRNHDMQVILNLLMGNEEPINEEDFEFDDLSMSAACEVMNQMMGAAATALSDILEKPINISTPVASIVDADHPFTPEDSDVESDTDIISISFDLVIKGVMNTNFVSVLPLDLARSIVNQLLGGQDAGENEAVAESVSAPAPAVVPAPEQIPVPPVPVQPVVAQEPPPPVMPQQTAPPVPVPQPIPQQAPMTQPAPAYQPQPMMQQPPVPQQAQAAYPQQMPPYQQMPMQGYPGMPYPPYPQQPMYPQQMYGAQNFAPEQKNESSVQRGPTVKKAQFPDFSEQDAVAHTMNSTNMSLLLNVPLDVSVEIGKTKRKIKEIADFGQGTVIELEKQAGAPVDIIVNGQLLAHGDVVVIGDNFGVRITEIVGTKDLMDSLTNLS